MSRWVNVYFWFGHCIHDSRILLSANKKKIIQSQRMARTTEPTHHIQFCVCFCSQNACEKRRHAKAYIFQFSIWQSQHVIGRVWAVSLWQTSCFFGSVTNIWEVLKPKDSVVACAKGIIYSIQRKRTVHPHTELNRANNNNRQSSWILILVCSRAQWTTVLQIIK